MCLLRVSVGGRAVTTVEFPLEDGGVLLVRVDDGRSDGPVLRGGGGTPAWERAETTFEAALGTIDVVARGVLQQLTGLARTPDVVQVDFGLELNAKAGTFLAAAGTAAHLKVALTWRPEQSGSSADRDRAG